VAAVDYFLKIDGIAGESTARGHEGEIEVLSFSWGESQTGIAAAGGGAGAGKVSMQDFHFSMRTSKASPLLLKACATGQHIKNAVLVARRGGESPQQFLKYTLTDVLVSSYNLGGFPPSDSAPFDKVNFDFAKVEVEYRRQLADGSVVPAVQAGWDVKTNKAV
jgi:type VI secretion system secreted protein Hcp